MDFLSQMTAGSQFQGQHDEARTQQSKPVMKFGTFCSRGSPTDI